MYISIKVFQYIRIETTGLESNVIVTWKFRQYKHTDTTHGKQVLFTNTNYITYNYKSNA